MSTKEKKIKRLRKAKIWPSVLFLIFSLFIANVAFIAYLVSSMVVMVDERIAEVFITAEKVSLAVDPAKVGSVTDDDLRLLGEFSEGIFILDKDGNTIASLGEMTFDLSDPVELPDFFLTEDKNDIFVDTVFMDNLFDKEGAIHLDRLLREDSLQRYFDWAKTGKPGSNEHIFDACIWKRYNLSEGAEVFIKCQIPLYYRDFVRSLTTGVIALIVMTVPLILFFINIILTLHNQKHLTKLVSTDLTTGGRSYLYFEDRAVKTLRSFRNASKLYMIADVTVMKYRSYCSCHGTKAGEELIEAMDKHINSFLGKKEVCAYSGKASFALFLECPDKAAGEARVTAMVNELTQRFRHGGITIHGGIFFCEPGNRQITPADCFNRASAARATAVDDTAPACVVYNDKLLEEQLWEHRVEEKMQAALDNEEFKVYVQPKYDPVTEKLAGAEALVRWINAEDGFISPGRFIPIFEKNGFITKLDDYMLSHVAKLQAEWLTQGKDIVPISVNVSRAHFANPDLAQHICELVDLYGVPHKFIEIELTESAFFDDKAALLRTVHQLRELGFEISMDDFGAGYSSLNSLKDLPLDVLKLDAEFFRGESEENRGEIVVSQAIKLAKSLNMRIVAEGVEKKEQVDFLAGQGCDMIQGFYFAKPMPADEYETRLAGNAAPVQNTNVSGQ